MSTSAFPAMARYFKSIVDELISEAQQAGFLQNPTAVGTGREEIYRRLLERHLPSTCEVFRGGYVFNAQGKGSKQIDVIVTAGPTPRFEILPKLQAIAPLEGTIAVAEVKSKLDKKQLLLALDNLASLPKINAPEDALAQYIKVGPDFWWDWPYKVIFAYDGIDKEAVNKYVSDFYKDNPNIDLERRPSLIHVLGKYIYVRKKSNVKILNADGSEISNPPPPGGYAFCDIAADVSAMAYMFTELQHRTFVANHMIWKYRDWIDPLIAEVQKQSTTG